MRPRKDEECSIIIKKSLEVCRRYADADIEDDLELEQWIDQDTSEMSKKEKLAYEKSKKIFMKHQKQYIKYRKKERKKKEKEKAKLQAHYRKLDESMNNKKGGKEKLHQIKCMEKIKQTLMFVIQIAAKETFSYEQFLRNFKSINFLWQTGIYKWKKETLKGINFRMKFKEMKTEKEDTNIENGITLACGLAQLIMSGSIQNLAATPSDLAYSELYEVGSEIFANDIGGEFLRCFALMARAWSLVGEKSATATQYLHKSIETRFGQLRSGH